MWKNLCFVNFASANLTSLGKSKQQNVSLLNERCLLGAASQRATTNTKWVKGQATFNSTCSESRNKPNLFTSNKSSSSNKCSLVSSASQEKTIYNYKRIKPVSSSISFLLPYFVNVFVFLFLLPHSISLTASLCSLSFSKLNKETSNKQQRSKERKKESKKRVEGRAKQAKLNLNLSSVFANYIVFINRSTVDIFLVWKQSSRATSLSHNKFMVQQWPIIVISN